MVGWSWLGLWSWPIRAVWLALVRFLSSTWHWFDKNSKNLACFPFRDVHFYDKHALFCFLLWLTGSFCFTSSDKWWTVVFVWNNSFFLKFICTFSQQNHEVALYGYLFFNLLRMMANMKMLSVSFLLVWLQTDVAVKNKYLFPRTLNGTVHWFHVVVEPLSHLEASTGRVSLVPQEVLLKDIWG